MLSRCIKMFYVVFLNLMASTLASLVYDTYSGRVITPEIYAEHIRRNTTFWCTNEIAPCDPTERRRIDGSCNNLKHPSRGASQTPGYHVLPLVFNQVSENELREKELPLVRKVRTTLLLEGRLPDQKITHLLTYFWVFMSADVLSFHDTINYLTWKTHCCGERGKTDPECISIPVPDDDPVLRFSDVRCLNLTRPFTFQSTGCTGTNNPPERIISATPVFDLSQIYRECMRPQLRLYKNGLLSYEAAEGRIWPPSKYGDNICIINQPPRETRCHDMGDESNNGVLGTNLFTIWMWRHHNYIATQLATINPCWDDDMLFYTAREINIAVAMQIFLYELHPIVLGKENLIKEGVLSANPGYRDVYNENILPQVSIEYGLSLRWAHTIQEGTAKMYDTNGNYLKSMSVTDLTLRTGYLAIGNNLDYITQGAFRQAAGKIDDAVDPNIAESGLGSLQRVLDIPANDLAKNRYLGIASYVQFRQFCFNEIYNTFDDLLQAMEPERIQLLKELYEDVNDIDLLAGIWVERPISKARAPATFYCLMVDQLLRTVVSDRHWYERRDRPNAFTIDQLLEIRKSSIARLICNVGDKVTEIQPSAFLIPGPGNEIVSCDAIPEVDFHAWKDARCNNRQETFYG